MQTDTLIIGQGLCGTWLSYWLQQAGADFMVMDEDKPNTASKVASGIINPVTGRRMVKTWLADELLPFAEKAYTDFGILIGEKLLEASRMLDFFASPDRRLSFEKRAGQFEAYLSWPQEEHDWLHYFNYPFGYGIIEPVYRVAIQTMLVKWKAYLESNSRFIPDKYEGELLDINDKNTSYKDITANRIIFCDGTAAMQHHFFSNLPFAINKGEALIIEVPDLPSNYLYKKTNVITPWQDCLFWVGSNYDREFTDDKTTHLFFDQTNAWLKNFLKLPYKTVDHLAALRPTTVERRPFAGMHPQQPLIGILNGMGTKGVSLAPYIAKQMADHLLHGTAIMPEADVKQYSRLLQRF